MTTKLLTQDEILLKEMSTPEFFALLDRDGIISPTEGATEINEQDVLKEFSDYLKLFGDIGEHSVCSEAGCKAIEGFDEFWKTQRWFDELVYLGKLYINPPTNKGVVTVRFYKLEKFRSVDYSEDNTAMTKIANYIKLNYYKKNLSIERMDSSRNIGPKTPEVMGNIFDIVCNEKSSTVNRITVRKTIPDTSLRYTEVFHIYDTVDMFMTEKPAGVLQFGGIVDLDDNTGWKIILKNKFIDDKDEKLSVGTIGASVAKLYENGGYELPIGRLLNVLADDAECSDIYKARTLRKIIRAKIVGAQHIDFITSSTLLIDVNMIFNDNGNETQHRVQIIIITKSHVSGLEVSITVDKEILTSDAIINIDKKKFVFDHNDEYTDYELKVDYANWEDNEE